MSDEEAQPVEAQALEEAKQSLEEATKPKGGRPKGSRNKRRRRMPRAPGAEQAAPAPDSDEINFLRQRVAELEATKEEVHTEEPTWKRPYRPDDEENKGKDKPKAGAPPMPRMDKMAGDKTPAVVDWYKKYWPEEFERRYKGRRTYLKAKKPMPEDISMEYEIDEEGRQVKKFKVTKEKDLDTEPRQY